MTVVAEAGAVVVKSPPPIGVLDSPWLHDPLWFAAMHHIDDRLDVESTALRYQLIGHCNAVRRQDDIVESQQRIVGRRRLGIENVETGAGDSPRLQHLGRTRPGRRSGRARC